MSRELDALIKWALALWVFMALTIAAVIVAAFVFGKGIRP